jgi:hypothetical protein
MRPTNDNSHAEERATNIKGPPHNFSHCKNRRPFTPSYGVDIAAAGSLLNVMCVRFHDKPPPAAPLVHELTPSLPLCVHRSSAPPRWQDRTPKCGAGTAKRSTLHAAFDCISLTASTRANIAPTRHARGSSVAWKRRVANVVSRRRNQRRRAFMNTNGLRPSRRAMASTRTRRRCRRP